MKLVSLALALTLAVTPAFAVTPKDLIATSVAEVVMDITQSTDDGYKAELTAAAQILTADAVNAKYPEVVTQPGLEFVEIKLDDCVYDVVVVSLDSGSGVIVSKSYIDLAERR